MRTAKDMINVMQSWEGKNEADGSFKEIIDLYNSMKPLPRGYKLQYDDEWCAGTIAAAAIKSGCVELIGRECSCSAYIEIFKRLGIWIEDGTITPLPGYLILYDWDECKQPNDNQPDHIGLVEAVRDGVMSVLEGNKGEVVSRRVVNVGWGCIRGYAAPHYDNENVVLTRAEAKKIVQEKTGWSNETIWYIADAYTWGEKAIIDIAMLILNQK
jgi:hypothetical protein